MAKPCPRFVLSKTKTTHQLGNFWGVFFNIHCVYGVRGRKLFKILWWFACRTWIFFSKDLLADRPYTNTWKNIFIFFCCVFYILSDMREGYNKELLKAVWSKEVLNSSEKGFFFHSELEIEIFIHKFTWLEYRKFRILFVKFAPTLVGQENDENELCFLAQARKF